MASFANGDISLYQFATIITVYNESFQPARTVSMLLQAAAAIDKNIHPDSWMQASPAELASWALALQAMPLT